MKNKGKKITLIIVLSIIAILLIGLMIFFIVSKNNNLEVSLIGIGDKTEMIFQNEYNPEDFESINVDMSSTAVKIQETNTDKIKVTVYGEKDDKINATINERELSINKENNKVFILTFLYWCNEEIIIEIPNNSDQDFKVKTSSGDITAPDLETSDIQFETSSGNIVCGNINNGTVKSTSGDITLENGNELTVSSTSGKIKVGKFNKIIANATSGDISVTKIEKYCEISSTSGKIDIDTCNITENSSISATSGDVKINNKNDIYIETETGSGYANIENNNRKADIELKIKTTSGNIKVN